MKFAVTGYIASGKDVLCNILEKEGFKHISLSDILRQMLAKEGKEASRKNLTWLGNHLRQTKGDDVLAKNALKQVDDSNWLVSSVGRVAEAQTLKQNGFKVIFVDAKQEIRYERVKKRNRKGDSLSFEAFKKQEELESKGGNKKFREFDNLKKEADIIISNNGSLKEFKEKIEELTI